MLAAEAGHFDIAHALIRSGADVKFSGDGSTPLVAAADGVYSEILTLLLDHGATTEPAGGGSSALMRAACGGYASCVKILLTRGADPQLRDVDGLLALHYAIIGGQWNEEVSHLLKTWGAGGPERLAESHDRG